MPLGATRFGFQVVSRNDVLLVIAGGVFIWNDGGNLGWWRWW